MTKAFTFQNNSMSCSFSGFCLFIFLAAPHGMWDLSFPTRDGTCTLVLGVWGLRHWTTREAPGFLGLLIFVSSNGSCLLEYLLSFSFMGKLVGTRGQGPLRGPGHQTGTVTAEPTQASLGHLAQVVGSPTRRPKNKGW